MLLQLPEGQVQRGFWGRSSRYFTMQTKAMFTGLFLQTNVEDLSYGLTPPARLKYFSDKNNNNKLSSTQKINCVQQGDRRVIALHHRATQERTDRQDTNGVVTGPRACLKRVSMCLCPQAGGSPGCAIRRDGPQSSSRASGLLFLGLSLHVLWATAIRGHLAKCSDSLETTRQLQQQRNELEGKRP